MTAAGRPCLEVFAGAPRDDTCVAYICSEAPECRCEGSQVSAHSDLPVDDSEILIRIIVDDTHVKPDNGKLRLKSSFLNDAASYGASTLRLGRATTAEFQAQLDQLLGSQRTRADGSPREVIGYVRLPVQVIRALSTLKDKEGRELVVRACAAYATALEHVPAHADVMINAFHLLSGSGRLRSIKELGAAVSDSFQLVNSLDEILALGV